MNAVKIQGVMPVRIDKKMFFVCIVDPTSALIVSIWGE